MNGARATTFDVVGIGASLYDCFIGVSEYPREDTKLRMDSQAFFCGGPAATGIVTSARMGASAAYLGSFSDDSNSKAMLADFAARGVDCSCSVIRPGFTAGSALVINSRKTSSRTIIWTRGDLPPPDPAELPEDIIAGARLLYLDGNHIEAAVRACQIAKAQGVKVFLDAGSPYPGIERILEHSDILIASESFAIEFEAGKDPEAGARSIARRFGPEILVVTQGDRGGFYLEAGILKRYPCFTPPGSLTGTNGAGDVFHGAFAYLHLQGKSLSDCLRFASASSAIKCARQEGRDGIPTRGEVEAFLATATPRSAHKDYL
jgi:sugar/nucleoside kinase (ribokinase family)